MPEAIDPNNPIAAIMGQNPIRIQRPLDLPLTPEEEAILKALGLAADETSLKAPRDVTIIPIDQRSRLGVAGECSFAQGTFRIRINIAAGFAALSGR